MTGGRGGQTKQGKAKQDSVRGKKDVGRWSGGLTVTERHRANRRRQGSNWALGGLAGQAHKGEVKKQGRGPCMGAQEREKAVGEEMEVASNVGAVAECR